MPRSKEEEHNRGQEDFSETKDKLLGTSRRTPWSSPFETQQDYDDRVDAYNKGIDNAAKNEVDKSSCYLSTAAVEARRKSRDCEELEMLQEFRDGFVTDHYRRKGDRKILSSFARSY